MPLFKYVTNLFRTNPPGKADTGKAGEEIACRYLKKEGCRIVEKNYRTRYGEVDIIALDKGVLCFIEVKSRKSSSFAMPEEYVDRKKQKKIIKTSLIYISNNDSPGIDKRFDVVSVDLERGKCRIIRNAFELD